MNKEYKFVDTIVNEEEGYVSIKENGIVKETYRIKTNEEKKFLETKNISIAITHVNHVLLALTVTPSALYFSDIYENYGLKTLLEMMGISVLGAIFFYFAIIFASSTIVYIFAMDKSIREEKRLKPTIFTIIVWAIIVFILSGVFSFFK